MTGLRILMYHAIGEPGEAPARFVLPVDAFERQLAWFRRLRFNVVRLEDAVRRLLAKEPLPRRAVALTFDDGTQDLATLAHPLLQRYELPATAFVVTGAMGGTVTWTDQPGLSGRRVLTWEEASALEPLVSLEPHTRTHPSLPTLDDERLRDEIGGSRTVLEACTGHSHELFAYPYGHFDERVAGAVQAAGYAASVTMIPGSNTASLEPFALRRHEVAGTRRLFSLL
jgi:peptidoglycan/xylan/chitin deacetylase (PgdA/CDA1 family)